MPAAKNIEISGKARGTLYERAEIATPQNEINKDLDHALGPAAYISKSIQPAEAFRATIRTAIARHPAFHAQTATLNQANAATKTARSALYPQLSAVFSGDYAVARSFDTNTDNVVESLRPREQFTLSLIHI